MRIDKTVACPQCKARGAGHLVCPTCSGRGCISPAELAKLLNLERFLDVEALTIDAVAKALDARSLKHFAETEKREARRADEMIASAERAWENERKQWKDERIGLEQAIVELRGDVVELQTELKEKNELLQRRRHQPAAVGRAGERDFVGFWAAEPDLRFSDKLYNTGDFLCWYKVDDGGGQLTEAPEPILCDTKVRKSPADWRRARAQLVRDARARKLAVGPVRG